MADWARADASDRNQLVEEWKSGKLALLKSESTSDADVTTDQIPEPESGIQIDENDDETTRYPVVRMPFRKQLLAQFTADELRHHLTREEYEGLCALEMDTDNGYVQNLLLAAENCEEVKGYDTKDLWRYTDAIRKVFSQEKRHELALVLRFTRIWAVTDYIDRGILVREWATGNRISNVRRTDSGTNADGGYVTDRGEGAHHTWIPSILRSHAPYCLWTSTTSKFLRACYDVPKKSWRRKKNHGNHGAPSCVISPAYWR